MAQNRSAPKYGIALSIPYQAQANKRIKVTKTWINKPLKYFSATDAN
jgi:hypothetical protein